MKFSMGVGIHDVIAYAKYNEHRLRGLGVVRDQLSDSPSICVVNP